ncbi:MAG: YggT family protein [Firmicutes bacterium]|nr:YggT family protein [Bacillota bacterium]
MYFITIIKETVLLAFSAYMLLLLIRVIIDFLPIDEDGTFYGVVMLVTESVVSPVRAILDKTSASSLPFDASVIVTYFALEIVYYILAFFF